MPGTITRERLRELAAFRASRRCALSLYVGLDPSDVPTPQDAEARLRALLDEAERRLDRRDASKPAYECPSCGRAQTTDGGCPLDGTAMESGGDGFDVAVHKTLVNGGAVRVIRGRRDLEPVGGVAALLRY